MLWNECVEKVSDGNECEVDSDCNCGYCWSSGRCCSNVPNGESCDKDSDCQSGRCDEGNLFERMQPNFQREKNAFTIVTALVEIVHRKDIVVLNPQMEGAAIKIPIANLGAAMKARFGTNVRQNFQREKNVTTTVTALWRLYIARLLLY